MATTYNTAFGSLPGYNEMLGTTNTTGGGQQQVYGQRAQQQRQQQQPAQTFAQMQRQGVARPAPPQAPQAQPFAQYGGSQQAQQMRQRLQSQLEQFGQAPSRFDTQAFQQIRGAQAANLQQEYQGQLKALNEEMARRGLSASSVGGGRMGDLAGQQARALASLDAELLQRAAETQAQDRAQLLSASQGLAELAGSQDLAQFEANRVAQAATFENQLRAAQFGQQQFEQAGQEAFQGAQAEEAAQQAARAFDLQATGQAAGLSMDLQRLLGQQEIERAQLTGQLGGMQTLAGRQFGEQQRQFDIQQMLQAQLGLGGLSLEQQRFAEQARQFGVTSAEEQRQFNVQQALQAQLGLGGLGVQQAQLGLEQQRLAQQGQQFLAQLDEQQKARLQQGGFTTTELAIKRQQVDNELALQNRQLSETERNNLALRNLQRDQFESEKDFRSQQLGLNRDELEQRANQIKEDQRLRGVEIDDQRAYRDAEIDLRTTQISNEYNIAGRQIDEQEARRLAEQDINDADNTAQMERLKAQITSQEKVSGADRAVQQRQLIFQNAARLSEQSGVQYTVDADGEIVPLRDAQGNPVRTSAFTQAAEARKLQQEELTLRRQLGLMEATGQGLTVDAEGRIVAGTGATAQTLQARQLAFQNAARLSEQSGVQYTVKDDGTVDVLRDAQGNPVRTSAFTQADETRKQQETLTKLDINLRRQLGLTEATGQMYNIDPNTGVATTVAGGAQTVESRRVAAQERQMAIQSAMQLSEQSGIQHEVKTDGTVGPMRDASGQPMRTSALTQASLDRALREQLGLMEATGQVYTRDAAGTVSLATGAQAARTIQAQQLAFQRAAQLSEQSGIQHEVKADGTVAPLIVNNQPVRTSAESRFNLDLQFRRQMGLMEQTGQAFNIDPATGRATLATGAEALSTLGRLQQNLQNAQIMSQITGRQFTVNERGELVTTATAPTEAARQFNLEQALRQQLGLSELTGVVQPLGGFAGGAAATAPAAGQPSPLAGRFGTGVVAPGDAALASAYNMGIAPTQQLPYLNYGMGGIGGGGGMQTLAAQQQALQRAQILAQMTGKTYGLDAYGNVIQTGGETLEAQRVGIERTAAEAQQKLAAQNMFTQLVSTLAPFLPTSTTAATQSLADYMKNLMSTIRPTGGGSTGGTGGTGGDDKITFIPSSTNITGRFGLSPIPSSTPGFLSQPAPTYLTTGIPAGLEFATSQAPIGDPRYVGMTAQAQDGQYYRWTGQQWVVQPDYQG